MPRNLSAWWDFCIYLTVFAVMVMLLASFNVYAGVIGAVVWVCLFLFARDRSMNRRRRFDVYCKEVISNVNAISNHAIENLPEAIFVLNADGRLEWANRALASFLPVLPEQGMAINDVWPEFLIDSIWGTSGSYIFRHENKSYEVRYRPVASKDAMTPFMAFYILDRTEIEDTKKAYLLSRTALAFIQIDNYDEVLQGMKEAEKTSLLFSVNRQLDLWMQDLGGFLRRVSDDLYVAILDREALEKALADKFEILDRVRGVRKNSNDGTRPPVTLSFGIAVAEKESLGELALIAQAKLDLALGRGGDQVAVQMDGKTQFFGGKANAVEKHTRVKARVVAHALKELMENATEIVVMGHHNEDFDALGAAMGVAKMARELEKPVHIVLSDMNEGIDKFIQLLDDKEEYQGMLVKPDAFTQDFTQKPLLVVVDTHIPHLVASTRLLEEIADVVVIDHHRRSEECIKNPILFYSEPSSSSTSEMVTELLMYYKENIRLTRLDATALYSGIVVDTKNFSVQTGVRTFEAAAYLRRAGADPVLVRYLFRTDYDANMAIAKAKASSQMYDGGLIVADCLANISSIQAIAAQVADSLLRIEGVRMSIVFFQLDEETVGVSARSTGELNVQVIMEEFGGGGHQNVAGAQVKNVPLEEVHAKGVEIAKAYIAENG